MSLLSNSLDLIRRVFRRDQMTLPGGPDIYDSMNFSSQALGGMNLGLGAPQLEGSNYLSESVAIEQDIVSRYQDSEEMDQFCEISCLHGDSMVFTVEQGWKRIADLVGKEFKVLAFDKQTGRFVEAPGEAMVAAPEGHKKPMVHVYFGENIICTADHPFMTSECEWVEAGQLKFGQELMSDLRVRPTVLGVYPLEQRPIIYDLQVPGYHNFLCNSVIVHNTAFDLFADDATTQDVLDGRSLWFEAPDNVVQELLEEMCIKQLRIEEDLWELARGICKWGNEYKEIIAIDQVGVVELRNLHAPTMRRIQDPYGMLFGFIQDPALGFSISTESFLQRLQSKGAMDNYMDQVVAQSYDDLIQVYEPWEVVHFRNRSSNSSDPYGLSIADAARYAWRRLMMMEDSMVLYKLTRSAQRFAFYVDVGDVPPNQAKNLLNQVKNEFRKKSYTDRNGKLQTRYSPLSADEDLFLPVRKGNRATEVDVLSGPEGQQIEDVNYFKEKLISALKVPKSYLAGDDTVGRANLSQLDCRMARSVMRIQRQIKNGMKQVARVDLAAKNIDPDLVEFECHMNIPSGVLEMAQMEVQNAKLDLADKYQRANFPEHFVWSNILGLSDDEIEHYQRLRSREQQQAQGGQQQESVRATSRMIDESKRDRVAQNEANRILEEVSAGRTEFAKRMRELKMLVGEVRQAQSRERTSRKRGR